MLRYEWTRGHAKLLSLQSLRLVIVNMTRISCKVKEYQCITTCYLISKFKFPISSKLHVQFVSLPPLKFCRCLTAIFLSRRHERLSVKVGRKLKKVEKHRSILISIKVCKHAGRRRKCDVFSWSFHIPFMFTCYYDLSNYLLCVTSVLWFGRFLSRFEGNNYLYRRY